MRPFIGWSATVVITLGRSRMGSSRPLLSSPTGNDPAFPKLALIAHPSGGPRKVARLCGKRRSSAMIELSRLRGSERYAACSDEVLARPSARLSQRACCLKKLFTCQGTPCRRGQTVTGSGTGRAVWFGSPSIYNGHFFSKTWYCQRKISENLSTLLSESAPGFVPMLCPFTLQRTKICRLLSMPVRKVFLCWLREPISAQAIFKILRGDRACKALSLGEVAAAVRLRIAGFGEGTPQQDSDGTE